MRISTVQAFNTGVQGIQNGYAKLVRTQEQISTGQRLLSPADDPVATVRLLQLDQEAGRLAQFRSNLDAAENSLNQEEVSLNSVTRALYRARELTLSSGNATMQPNDLAAIGQELKEIEDELYNLFNSRNSRGEYLFGGFQSDQQPFVRQPDGSYTYEGDEGQRSIQVASSKLLPINDNGKALFVDVPNVNRVNTETLVGNGRISLGVVDDKNSYDNDFYPLDSVTIRLGADAESYEVLDSASNVVASGPLRVSEGETREIRFAGVVVKLDGELAENDEFSISRGDLDPASSNREKRSILDTIKLMRESLEGANMSTEDKLLRRDMIAITISNLDHAADSVMGVQTSLGARLNVIDSTRTENEEVALINTTVQAQLSELDYAEALSRLSAQQIILQAAQQSFVKVSGLSLFNLIR